ncbi:sce7725 family protein [Tenacibaculum finnmarkense genomovar ulcerans]|uniref:sce7725 family protein n=1 Tax=Tenacibaculum finnmarkense TaxID=2781243 RepID=UPI00187B1B7D|nr:sce7725 family protein [Tenacibaculum finnmarkense]MBE7687154.1 sce7725 family protein [Tenacibaculum finnmarkense genomovar ulcerans]MCD8431913.1 sce7725 family protein [Tenacibaculum finnmarkense genomovar ulcerans]MCD8444451.1 sce7725 family protein [Tenacibaculum finnmarkense genomovar ulcerans]
MYFPYLRGKQFELIALREFSVFMSSKKDKISPIIEPVKDSSTLKSTLKELAENNINFNFIINPKVGNFKNFHTELLEILEETLGDYENFQLSIIVDKITQQGIQELLKFTNNIDLKHNGFTLIHTSEIGKNHIEQLNDNLDIKYNLIYFKNTSRRYYREFKPETRVSLDDYFKKLEKNSDYLKVPVSDFSEEYKFYSDDNFVGFSDFLTIGDFYSESGFLPRAVAIHLSYIEANKIIKVRHFTSDSNQDSSDIAGKFSEALQKLVDWCIKEEITETKGIKMFKDLHQRGHFPGLGSIKKISTINHIELVANNI